MGGPNLGDPDFGGSTFSSAANVTCAAKMAKKTVETKIRFINSPHALLGKLTKT
jgi:hypothetical protein